MHLNTAFPTLEEWQFVELEEIFPIRPKSSQKYKAGPPDVPSHTIVPWERLFWQMIEILHVQFKWLYVHLCLNMQINITTSATVTLSSLVSATALHTCNIFIPINRQEYTTFLTCERLQVKLITEHRAPVSLVGIVCVGLLLCWLIVADANSMVNDAIIQGLKLNYFIHWICLTFSPWRV